MASRNLEATRSAIVIGGGLIGTACAINLQSKGIRTTIVDPVSVRRAASWGNAGHIAVEQVEPLASLANVKNMPRRLFSRGGALALPLRDIGAWLPFSLRLLSASRPARFATGKSALREALATATPAWRRLLSAAGVPSLMSEHGHFVVWESPQSAASGRAAWSRADTGTASFRDVTPEERGELEALVRAPIADAIRFSGSGQMADLGLLAESLDDHFHRQGGKQHCGAAARLEVSGGAASVILDAGDRRTADVIVVAAGVGARRLLQPLGYRVPMIAERGYHLQSCATSWPADLPPVVFEDRSMIATRFRSGLRVASFVEFARAESPPDSRKWRRLRQHVRELGLPLDEPVSEWMGARPTLPDYLPAIGRSRRAANLLYAFGHQHLGLTLAAVTGEAIAALAAGGAAPIDVAPYDLERF